MIKSDLVLFLIKIDSIEISTETKEHNELKQLSQKLPIRSNVE